VIHLPGADRDGDIVVHVSTDEMLATVDLHPHQGSGKPLDLDTVEYALLNSGVTNGIDRESISEGIHRAETSGETMRGLVAARGVAARNTVPGRYEPAHQHHEAVSQSEAKIDFHESSTLPLVHKGDEIAKRILRQSGHKGMSVTGKEMPFTDAADEELEAGENVEVSGDGSYKAAEEGRVVLEKKRIRVESALVIDGDVDFSTGNVRFPKNVIVGGNVLDNFLVETNGNLTVKGIVGAAAVSAKGSIEVMGGITGKGRGTIRAGGSVHAAFVDNAVVFCLGDLSVASEIVNSTVHSNGRITCAGKKGAIIGGTTASRDGIECTVAGSEHSHSTRLETGVDVLVSSKHQKAEELMAHLSERITAATIAIEEDRNGGLPTQGHERELKELVNKLNELTVEKEKLRTALHPKEAEVHVRAKVFPGVVVSIHGVERHVTDAMGPTTFSFDAKKGRIVTDKPAPGGGHPDPGAAHHPPTDQKA
jgi:uncharacterized protein (DUF342 family)